MGEVYLAEDTLLGRTVALKVLSAELADDSMGLRRFLREARMAASLTHPNIVSVYEIGEVESVHFIAMEYVQGLTIRQKLAKGPIGIEACVAIAGQIANALHAAHTAGIIHRDIKPENLLLTDGGHIKVLDFGLAIENSSLTDASDERTKTQITAAGTIIGTMSYMSPEQLRGQPADVRSDVFALGLVIYEMLAGRRPFEAGSKIESAKKLMNDPPDALARFNYSVSPALERIVLKCIEKNPEWRYQSAREISIDLAALERHSEISRVSRLTEIVSPASQPPAPPATPPLRSRWKLWSALAALGLCGAAFGGWFFLQPARPGSVTVMPFTNASGDSTLDYAAAGLSESLRLGLARLPGLRIASWSDPQSGDDAAKDPAAVARGLHVKSMITGRLTEADHDVRLSVELIDTSNGARIWSRVYERPATELITVDESILADLGPRLIVGTAGVRPTDGRTSDAQAYDLYLRGRYSLSRRTPADLQIAVARFRESAEKDPGYALAHSGIADAYLMMANGGIQAPVTILPEAKAEALRAVELDPELAEAYTSYGFAMAVSDFDWTGSEAAFRRALTLNPQYALAHAWFGFEVLTPLKRYEEALIEIKRAIELEPNEPIYQHILALILYFSRRFDDSLSGLHQMNPSYLPAARLAEEAMCLDAMGKPAQAISVLGEADKAGDQFGQLNRSMLAYSYALAGRRPAALKMAAESDKEARGIYSSECDRSVVQVALGNRDRAMELLSECYDDRGVEFQFSGVDPRLEPLHADPRFIALLAKAGLR